VSYVVRRPFHMYGNELLQLQYSLIHMRTVSIKAEVKWSIEMDTWNKQLFNKAAGRLRLIIHLSTYKPVFSYNPCLFVS